MSQKKILYTKAKKLGYKQNYKSSTIKRLKIFIDLVSPKFRKIKNCYEIKFRGFFSQTASIIFNNMKKISQYFTVGDSDEYIDIDNLLLSIYQSTYDNKYPDGYFHIKVCPTLFIIQGNIIKFVATNQKFFNKNLKKLVKKLKKILQNNNLSKIYRMQAFGYDSNDEKFKTSFNEKNISHLRLAIMSANERLNDKPYISYPHLFTFEIFPPTNSTNGDLYAGELNCLYNICCILGKTTNYTTSRQRMEKKFPEFKNSNPGVSVKLAEEMLNTAQLTGEFYTSLGLELNTPWYTLNEGNRRKVIKILSSGKHATLIHKYTSCKSVIYDIPKLRYSETKKRNEKYIEIPNDIDICYKFRKWFIKYNDGNPIIHKLFRPSDITKNPTDDDDKEYFSVHSGRSLIAKMFKKDHKIETTRINYDEIWKRNERFIGSRKILDIIPNLVEKDHNKNYCSYQTNEYYMGFPTNRFFSKSGPPDFSEDEYKPALMTIKNIVWKNDYALQAFNMLTPFKGVIDTPTYLFFKNYADIEVNDTIYSVFQDIDIVEYFNKFDLNEKKTKIWRNCTIGHLIAGGVKEECTKTFYNQSEPELERIKYECYINNYEYDIDDVDITVKFPIKNTSASFHVHSYILSYAAIAIMKEYIKQKENGNKVYGYHVDCLLIEDDKLPDDVFIGGWKYIRKDNPEYTKKIEHYQNIQTKNIDFSPIIQSFTINAPFWPYPIKNKIVINGAPGVNKTGKFIDTPFINQVILEPTLTLRNSLYKTRVRGDNMLTSLTWQKYFYEGTQDRNKIRDSRPKYDIVIGDEFPMMTPYFINRSVECTNYDNSFLILIGDFCQLRNTIERENGQIINKGGITREMLIEKGFSIYDIIRTPEMMCRHEYEEGIFLDKLRKFADHPTSQVQKVLNTKKFKTIKINEITNYPNTKIISGNHKRISYINRIFKKFISDENKVIEVRTLPEKNIVHRKIKNKYIWWKKQKMEDEPDFNEWYLPTFSETIDSVQGQTIEKLIVDIKYLTRYGAAYTAITRTKKLENIILLI